MLRIVVVVLLILLLIGAIPHSGFVAGWAPSGGIGLVLIIVLILMLAGVI